MKRFMVLYNAPVPAAEMMSSLSPEEAKAGMDAWMAWSAQTGDALVDFGMPVQAARRVTADAAAESTNQASGYSIVQAEDVDAATALMAKHPHLQMVGASIDVLEILPMPGM
ncbi:MAG: hypothetical protein ABIM89_14520 [Mycobacteriales bacterium]